VAKSLALVVRIENLIGSWEDFARGVPDPDLRAGLAQARHNGKGLGRPATAAPAPTRSESCIA
jgi:hypothetical protein